MSATEAERHRSVAAEFSATVQGVSGDGWDAPAPPQGWVARDVVRHLTEWLPAFLHGATGVTLESGPSVDEDPVEAWAVHSAAVQALLDDRAVADGSHDFPHMGTMTIAEVIDRIYTVDVFMHRWDLARATGQDESLDPVRCEEIYQGMLPMDEVLRQSGQFGPRVPVADDADAQTRLLGFIGRVP